MSNNPYKTVLIYRILKFNEEFCKDLEHLKKVPWELEDEKYTHYENYPPQKNESLHAYQRRMNNILSWFYNLQNKITKEDFEIYRPEFEFSESPNSIFLKQYHSLEKEQLYWRYLTIKNQYQGNEEKFMEEHHENVDLGKEINIGTEFIRKWHVKPFDLETGQLLFGSPYFGDGYVNNPFYDRNYVIDELGIDHDPLTINGKRFKKREFEIQIEEYQKAPSYSWFHKISDEKKNKLIFSLKEKVKYWEKQERIANFHHKIIRINLNQSREFLLKHIGKLISKAEKAQKASGLKRVNQKDLKKIERWVKILELKEKDFDWPKIAERLLNKKLLTNTKKKKTLRKKEADKITAEYQKYILPFVANGWKILLGSTNWNHPLKSKY